MATYSKPHSYLGIPEAEKVLRLIGNCDSESDVELIRMAVRMGIASCQNDMATLVRRMKSAAEDAIKWHGPNAA